MKFWSPMRVAGLLTIGWLLFLGWLTTHVQQCHPLLPMSQFSTRFLSCLKPNELGDYVAGAFAPLAFIWFAATVFMQNQELFTQRQELLEGRRLATEQSRAAKAQAQEAREQTRLLVDAHQYNKAVQMDHFAKEELQGFHHAALWGDAGVLFISCNWGRERLLLSDIVRQTEDPFAALLLAETAIGTFLASMRQHNGLPIYNPVIVDWANRLERLNDMRSVMTAGMSARIADLNLHSLVRSMREFKNS